MRRALQFVIALSLAAGAAGAQASRPRTISAAEAQQAEAALASKPNDRAARAALLDYYFLNSALDPAQAIPARRRHILWLIQNTPADPLAGSPAATIDAAGHRLADATGYKQASEAWRAQAAKPSAAAAALVNAAYFFKLSDKAFTVALLERALALEPGNQEFAARLGDQYALIIMGITMVNKNTFPLGSDPAQTQSALAKQARDALTTTQNPYVLAKAGYMLSFQGTILRGMGKLGFDTSPWADYALQRAVSLAPNDPGVAEYMAQHREIQNQVRAAGKR
jgi:hypothetical protein